MGRAGRRCICHCTWSKQRYGRESQSCARRGSEAKRILAPGNSLILSYREGLPFNLRWPLFLLELRARLLKAYDLSLRFPVESVAASGEQQGGAPKSKLLRRIKSSGAGYANSRKDVAVTGGLCHEGNLARFFTSGNRTRPKNLCLSTVLKVAKTLGIKLSSPLRVASCFARAFGRAEGTLFFLLPGTYS